MLHTHKTNTPFLMADVESTSAAAPKDAPIYDANEEPQEATAKRLASERRLWWWNLACGILHLVQAAVVLGIGECRCRVGGVA